MGGHSDEEVFLLFKRLSVLKDHEATVEVDGFPSTFFAFDEVDAGLVAQDVAEGLADTREVGVHRRADEIGEVVDGGPEQFVVAIGRDAAIDVVQLGLVVVQISQRHPFLVEKEEDVECLAEGRHLHLGIVSVGEENVAIMGDIEPADLLRDVVFEYGVDDDLVQPCVLELVMGGSAIAGLEFLDEARLPWAACRRIDVQDVGFKPCHTPYRVQRVAIDFDDEEVVAVPHHWSVNLEEIGRLLDVQPVGVEVVEKDLLGEKNAVELGKVAVDMVELLG